MKILRRLFLVLFILVFISGAFTSGSVLSTSLITFSNDIFQKLALQKTENTFISPASIYLALAMAYNGARGNTQKAMAECLKANHISINELNRFGKEFMGYLHSMKNDVTINIANSIWIRHDFRVLPDFIRRNADSYSALVKNITMNQQGLRTINQWIEKKTQQKIKDMLKRIDPAAVMFLVNAIYFLGNWEKKFDERLTRDYDFHLAEGGKIKTKTMNQFGDFPYYENEDFQAVRLDYKNKKLGMVLVLPREGKPLSGLLRTLSFFGQYDKIIANLNRRKGSVFIPRFKFKYSKDLIPVLKSMGMGVAFTSAANFTGINPNGRLFINLVQHDAFVEVNETGTEAAAATIVGFARTSAPQYQVRPFVFRADRPFFYFIADNERKIPLFMGTLYKP